MTKSNIPEPLAKAPAVDLPVNQQDPKTIAAVTEFLRQKAAEVSGKDTETTGIPSTVPAAAPPIEIKPDDAFSTLSPSDMAISSVVPPDYKLVVSELEKELFLKAILNDEPVRMTVALYQGRLKLEMRSRTVYEQRRIFDVLELDRRIKEMNKEEDNAAWMATRFQQYLVAVMLERINGKLFSELKLEPGPSLEHDAQVLRDFVTKNLDGMAGIRWNSILTGFCIFENKCAKLNSEALNEVFWNPPGSVS